MDLIKLWVGAIDQDEFILADGLRIVSASVFRDRHLTLNCEQVGKEFADEEKNESEVDSVEPEFCSFQRKAAGIGNSQVDEHKSADGVPAEHGNAHPCELVACGPLRWVLPCYDKALEIKFLCVPDSIFNLIDSPKEDEYHRSAEKNHSQL